MIVDFLLLVGLILFFFNFSYKYFLRNFFFLIVLFILLQCGGLVD